MAVKTEIVNKNNKLDIRRYLSGSEPEMSSVSEIIGEASRTLSQPNIIEEIQVDLSAATPIQPSYYRDSQEESQEDSQDDEIMLKSHLNMEPANNNNGASGSDHDHLLEQDKDSESLNNMTNTEMYQLLLSAKTSHKEEIKKLVQQSEVRCKQVEDKFELEKTTVINIKEVTDQCILDRAEIAELKEQVRCLGNLVVRQDAKITELQ